MALSTVDHLRRCTLRLVHRTREWLFPARRARNGPSRRQSCCRQEGWRPRSHERASGPTADVCLGCARLLRTAWAGADRFRPDPGRPPAERDREPATSPHLPSSGRNLCSQENVTFVRFTPPCYRGGLAAEGAEQEGGHTRTAESRPHGLDVDRGGQRAFVACEAGVVAILDLDTGGELARLESVGEPDNVWSNPALDRLSVAAG